MIQPHGVDEEDGVAAGTPVVEVVGSDVDVESPVVLVNRPVAVVGDVAAVVLLGPRVVVGGSVVVVVGVVAGSVVPTAEPRDVVVRSPPPVGVEGVSTEVLGWLPEGSPDPELPHAAASVIPATSVITNPSR